ncbi:MAG: O-antigen ligase family protein [Candidatus Aminicenantes bacterium]|nr:MAG: O-antigen ligase family protein [Candidatus Aminicenantes bacterium]
MLKKIKHLIGEQGKPLWKYLLPIIFSLYLLFSMVSISVSQIFLSLSLLCWIIFLIKEKQKPLIPSFFWPLIAYSGLSLISSFRSVNPEISLRDSKELLLFLIIPIVYTGFRQGKALKKASLALLASAYLCSLYSLLYFFFKAQPGERITGFMGHYMTQAGILLLFCSMALSMFFFLREKARFLWGIGLLLAVFPLVLTQTRSAWIGLVIAASLIILLYKPKVLIIIPIAAGLFFIASPQHMKKRALSIFSLETYSNRLRIEYTKAGIEIIKDFPLLGSGPDTVDMVFQNPKYGLSEDAKMNVHLHNNIIQIGAERGIPTLLAWITFLAWAFISLIKLLKNKDPTIYPFTVTALAALLALASSGLFEYNFGDSEITTLFLYMITVPFTLDLIKKREPKD